MLRDPALLTGGARKYLGYGAAFPEGFADTFKRLVARVYETVAAGEPPGEADAGYPTFRDGLAALSVHEAALTSGGTGRWERVAQD